MNIANVITGSRLVWFVVFVWGVETDRLGLAALMFLAAWGLDAVDGWAARRMGQVTEFGYILDKAVDRTVLIVGLIVLLMNQVVPDYAFLILAKDIAALPTATVQLKSMRLIPSMGKGGKLAVVGQGAAVLWVWADLPGGWWIVLAVAVLGALVGGQYVWRVYSNNGRTVPGAVENY